MNEAQSLFQDYLVKHRLKVTPQRKRILEVFLRSEGHFSAEDLYHRVRKKDSTVGQATVYRTLKILHDCGIAREVHFGDGVTRYEHMVGHEHHDHLICDRCGKNLEVVDPEIEALQERLAKKHGYTLTGHRMYLYGVCPDCQKK